MLYDQFGNQVKQTMSSWEPISQVKICVIYVMRITESLKWLNWRKWLLQVNWISIDWKWITTNRCSRVGEGNRPIIDMKLWSIDFHYGILSAVLCFAITQWLYLFIYPFICLIAIYTYIAKQQEYKNEQEPESTGSVGVDSWSRRSSNTPQRR